MLKKFSELVTTHPWIVLSSWFVIFFLGAIGALNISDVYEVSHYSETGSSDSDLAASIIVEEFGDFHTRRGSAFFIIYEAQEGINVTNGIEYKTLIENTANMIIMKYGTEKYIPFHYWMSNESSLVSVDVRATYLMLIPHLLYTDYQETMQEDTEEIRLIVKNQVESIGPPTLKRYAVTGTAAANTDAMNAAHESMRESDIIAMITVTLVLLFVFGSALGVGIPVAALISVLVTGLGVLFFLGSTNVIEVSDVIPSMISMLGIGICADYNLLLVSRFREEIKKGSDSVSATRKSLQTAGMTVIFSGFTVMIGFGCLVVLGGAMTFSLALAVILTVSLAIISVHTLSAAILVVAGHKLEWPNWLASSVARIKAKGSKEGQSFWARWSRVVQKRPWTFLIFGLLIVSPFVLMAFQLKLSLPGVEFLPKGTESRNGFELMDEHFSVGELSPVSVVLQNNTKANNSVFSSSIISGIRELYGWIVTRHEVAVFTAPSAYFNILTPGMNFNLSHSEFQYLLSNTSHPEHSTLAELIQETVDWDATIGGNNDTAALTIMLGVGSGSSKSWNFINDLRRMLSQIFPDVTHHVGGQSASFLDANNELWADFPLMVTLCMILTFIVLMILFRSIILPLKSILTILISVLLSYGVLVLVFQEGIGANLIGTEASGEGIIFFMPLFLFTAIFGLSMDYNVFILSRVKEEYDLSGNNTEAVALGIEKTGSVVTSAALIMVATFGVFIFSDLIFMQMLGLGLAIAVIVDATLIRLIILPSAMKLLGKWNWWLPDWLDRILPKIKIEH